MGGTNIVGGGVVVMWSGRPRPLPLTLASLTLGMARSCHSEARRRRARNFCCEATIHVETAASAVSGAKRRQVANKRAEQTSARKPSNSSPEGRQRPHARVARTVRRNSPCAKANPARDCPWKPLRSARAHVREAASAVRGAKRRPALAEAQLERIPEVCRKPRPSGHSTS